MRRFSQRSSLVTLSEINITPLLDLAFVLLIIFVITTPLLEQALPLKLPQGGKPDKPIDKRDVRTVEVGPQGIYALDRRPMKIDQVESELVKDFHANPNLVVYLRADESSRWRDVAAVLDRCQRHGITRISPRTEPPRNK
jgi:biopolymer transport protein ExbD/biopolymer transport protein TolR